MMSEPGIGMAEKAVGTLWGAALGDALGWPHEERARGVRDGSGLSLSTWKKRSGGRFMAHEETIDAGSYSDDTQLILAVARARLSGTRWTRHLAGTELPFWPLYERGGGGATLRATRLLQRGILPWEAAPVDREKYLTAGGNGVAMRVAPHVLFDAGASNFATIAEAVMADGVLTHGHPRALVGALVYAFGLWRALMSKGTLRYGQLLEEVSSEISEWARVPDIGDHWPSWRANVLERDISFIESWDQTVGEVRDALDIAHRGLRTGALALDEETLQQLGCLDRRTNGAGTVGAVAAIFLASKHAASPFEGVARAALAKGADTDTLASMTGALSGAVSGTEWMRGHYERLQDARYIADLARQLAARSSREKIETRMVRPRVIERFFDDLELGETIRLPFGGDAMVLPHNGIKSLAPSMGVRAWRLEARSGQTLFVRRFQRNSPSSKEAKTASREATSQSALVAVFAGVTLSVESILRSRELYCTALGLNASREGEHTLQLGDHLALRQRQIRDRRGGTSTIYLKVPNIEMCLNRVSSIPGINTSQISEKSGRRAFTMEDFDGNFLEIFQA